MWPEKHIWIMLNLLKSILLFKKIKPAWILEWIGELYDTVFSFPFSDSSYVMSRINEGFIRNTGFVE